MKRVPDQIISNAECDICIELNVEVLVVSTEQINARRPVLGLITSYDRKYIFINGRPYDREKYVFLTENSEDESR
jgi:hypothetical protein